MNILIIRTNTSDFGKVGSYNVQEIGLAKSLIAEGNQVNVIFLHKNVNKIVFDKHYSFVHYFPRKKIGLHGYFDINYLDKYSADKIIYFSDNQLFSKRLIKYSLDNNIKIILYWGAVLSTTPRILNKLYTLIILFINWSAYRKVINIAKTKKVSKILKRFLIPCTSVINIGLDTSLLNENLLNKNSVKSKLGLSSNDKIVLFVGRLEAAKKPMFALKILKKLVASNSNFKMIFIGEGTYLDKMNKYIKKNNLENSAIILGKINNSDIHIYYKISDVFINLSKIEIFGMAMLESMNYGTTVIARKAPGPSDFIVNNITGFLLDSYELNKWVLSILHATNNDNSSLIFNAKQSIATKFSWKKKSKEFLDLM